MQTEDKLHEKIAVLRLAIEVGCTPATVWKWVRGKPVSSATDYALRAAASKLGLGSIAREQ